MRLKTRFILANGVTHSVFAYLLTVFYTTHQTYFIIGECLVVISLIFSLWLYRAISLPFDIILTGIQSLKDKDFSMKLNKVGYEEMDELIMVYNLMIDQLREERLQQVERWTFLEKLIEASPSGVIILDLDKNIGFINSATARITAIDPGVLLGMQLNQIPGKWGDELFALEIDRTVVINLNGTRSYKCRKSTFIDRGYVRVFITIDELTHEIYIKEKNAYEKVVKIMSHEVNNSIGAINSILHSCLNYKMQLRSDDQQDYENALVVSINRNKSLSNLISNFASVIKVPDPNKQDIDLIALLYSIVLLMEPEARKNEVQWIWDIEMPQFLVFADCQQMEQVFINILKNAIEAVNPQGKICIKTEADPPLVSISNTGTVIPKEVKNQLFSPFFSTKKNGQGVGLMLVREILYNHNLRFSLESNENCSEFKIYF